MLMMNIKSTLGSVLRCNFLRREDGSIAIEAVIIMPVLFFTYLSIYSIFDTFRMYNINQKAAYTIGDAISRETRPLDGDYLAGAQELFEYLARSQGKTALRVTSVRYDGGDERFYTHWSKKLGWMEPLTDADMVNMKDRLPMLADNEHLVLVETWSKYDPPFRTGLENREIRNLVFTAPRYAPWVCWIECDP